MIISSVFASIPSLLTDSSRHNLETSMNGHSTQGDSLNTRFSAGPAPITSNVLWKANITGIQPYLTAFNGKIYCRQYHTQPMPLTKQLTSSGKPTFPMPLPGQSHTKSTRPIWLSRNIVLTPKQVNYSGSAPTLMPIPASSTPTYTAQRNKCSTSKSTATLKLGVLQTPPIPDNGLEDLHPRRRHNRHRNHLWRRQNFHWLI